MPATPGAAKARRKMNAPPLPEESRGSASNVTGRNMGKMKHQIRAEFMQLPLMLGKVLGGLAAVIGFTTAVLIMTRKSDAASGDLLPPLLLWGAGIAVFLLSARRLSKRSMIAAEETRPADITRMSMLSWTLFVLFAAIFLVVTCFLTW